MSALTRCTAGLLLLACSPVLLLIALIVKLHDLRSPVLFTQARIGKDEKLFTVYKFRTMVVGASSQIVSSACDSRITSIGRILRAYHLDELPQLINVVLGDMVFIGPRPLTPEVDAREKKRFANYQQRYRVKPGITGLRQLYPRHHARNHFILDLILIQQQDKPLFRIWVICKTIKHALASKGT